jgi:TPR repeat protein
MTWSYVAPGVSSKDTVRFLVQDTLEEEPLVGDEEIAWVLTQFVDVRQAAAQVAETIARLFARQANTKTPELSVDFAERAKQYRALAFQLKQESAVLGAIPYAGGISVSDKAIDEEHADRVRPAFVVGLDSPQREDRWL